MTVIISATSWLLTALCKLLSSRTTSRKSDDSTWTRTSLCRIRTLQ